jgi:hypothetical protein
MDIIEFEFLMKMTYHIETVGAVLAVLSTQLGTPRGRCDEHSGKFPSIVKPWFNRTSRRKKPLPKVDASWLW